ncbi:MAG: aminopeptidase P family N-terminal domain-containing protein, partial [Oscillospiraceae bacterium]
RIARDVQGKINWNNDLIGEIWTDRPAIFGEPVFCLAEQYSGKSTKEKLAAVRRQMKHLGADVHVLTTLDDIAWLFNIRGNDIPCNPVALCYAVLTAETAHLFIHEQAVFEAVREVLKQDNIELQPYDAIYDYVRKIDVSKTILLDAERINYAIYKSISGTIVDEMNPEIEMKAIKNPVEIENLKNCHIKDGVAVTKFLYWIKNAIGKQNITEMSASDYLEDRRKEQSHFMELSFDTISAYGEHAAMMHYSATEESNAKLSPKGMLLVDSGGQYLEGTTDITRTVVLGFVTDQMKQHYTAVVRGMLNLASIQFLQGCRGGNLDILAREPLWNLGLDYRCGTGHGVGYFLNVHEPPNQFRWRTNGGMDQSAVLKEGMITTDEPGVYLENQYGIRIENELLCCKGIQNEYG